MKNSVVGLLAVGALLFTGLFLMSSLSSCGDDDDDNDVSCLTYHEISLPQNPQEKGTPACDRTCLHWVSAWGRTCMQDLIDCAEGCGLDDEQCVDACGTCLDSCSLVLVDAKKRCADQCAGCLSVALQCEDKCGEDEICEEGCSETLYDCNDWDRECSLACNEDYDFCNEMAADFDDFMPCYDDQVDCVEGCYQSGSPDDDDDTAAPEDKPVISNARWEPASFDWDTSCWISYCTELRFSLCEESDNLLWEGVIALTRVGTEAPPFVEEEEIPIYHFPEALSADFSDCDHPVELTMGFLIDQDTPPGIHTYEFEVQAVDNDGHQSNKLTNVDLSVTYP